MRPSTLLATLLIAIVICVGVVSAQSPSSLSSPIAISHVTLINPATSAVEHDATVIIEGDHIGTVLIGAMVKMPGNTRLIDGHGKFLIPGLWDMHVHSAFGDWFPGGRDMGGDLPVLLDWRAQIDAGKIPGPRMIVAGPMLDAVLPSGKLRFPSSIAVTAPDSARAAVDQLKSQGSDFIKVQSVISHDAYLAAAAEAHKQNLPFVGHVPDKVRITEAIAAGQKSIEHLMGSFEGCSSEEQKFIDGQRNTKLLRSTTDQKKCAALLALLSKTQT